MERVYTYSHVRYLILVMITTGTFLQYVLNHDFGLISFPEDFQTNLKNKSDDCPASQNVIPDFFWLPIVNTNTQNVFNYRNLNLSSNERKSILNTYYYGIIFSQIFAGYFCLKFSIRNVVGYATVAAAMCNMFSFTTHQLSFWALFFLRFFIAFFSTFLFPGFFALIAKWAPPSERSFFVFGILMGMNLGYILIKPTLCFVSVLMTKEVWCSTLSFVVLIWTILWFRLVQDSPHTNAWMTYAEVIHITDSQEAEGYYQLLMVNHNSIPWKKINKCIPLWSLIFASFCHCWNFMLLLLYYPYSLTRIFGTNLNATSVLVMLPNIVHIFGALCFSFLQYFMMKKKKVSLTNCRKIFTLPAFILCGFILFFEANTDCDQLLSLILILLLFFLNSAVVSSILPNPIDLTPTEASTTFAIVNTISTLSLISIPKIVKPDSLLRWREILVASGSLYMISGAFFLSSGSGDIQDWCRPKLQFKHQEQIWKRKAHRLNLPMSKVLSDIMEETESKLKFSQHQITGS